MSAAEPDDGRDPPSPDTLIEWAPTTSMHLPPPSSGNLDLAIPEHLWGPRGKDGATEPASDVPQPPAIVPAPSEAVNWPAPPTPLAPPRTSVSGSSGQLDAAALDALLQPDQATPAPPTNRSGRLLRRLRDGHSR